MNTKFFFSEGDKRNKLSDLIKNQLDLIKNIKIITGFLTKAGFFSVVGKHKGEINNFLKKLDYLLVGKLTKETNDLFKYLYENFPKHKHKLYINLGIGRKKGNKINKFLPMVHSKIIAINYNTSSSLFYIGSANFTHFALNDLNAEAGIILSNLSSNERDDLSKYMDGLKDKKSTKLYDPEDAYDLMYLYSLSVKDEQNYLKEFVPIDKFSIVLCYNPYGTDFSIGDTFYTEITKETNKLANRIHGTMHYHIDRYIIFYFFKNLEDLIKMKLKSADSYCTVSTGLTKDPSIMKIDAIISYLNYIPPLIIPAKTKITIEPSSKKSYQAICRVIDFNNLPEEYRNYLDPEDNIPLTRNLVVTERVKNSHLFNSCSSIETDFNKRYVELESFNLKREFKTLSDILAIRQEHAVDTIFLENFDKKSKKFIEKIFSINKEGEIMTFLSEFEELIPRFDKSGGFQKSLDSFLSLDILPEGQRYKYFDFIKFLIKLDNHIKEMINLNQYLLTINKTLKSF